MDQFACKTFKTSRNLSYTYYHLSTKTEKPTLLLQHGFPDNHSLWSKVLPYLTNLQFPILIPDLLGYSGTSKPTDASVYNSKGMANDLAEILNHEGIKSIVSVGHDWGSFMAQRMWLWHPELVVGLILLNVPYSTPGEFNLEMINKVTEKESGLPLIAYWEFFTSTDGAKVMRDNIESFWTALHGENGFEELCCHYGALENFVKNDRRQNVKPYANDPEIRDSWIARHKKDGFEGPVNWYYAQKDGHHWAVEKELPKERYPVNVPVLFIGATEDVLCRMEFIYASQKAGLLPDLSIKEVKSGHWQTLEVPDQTGQLMAEWLKEKESVLNRKS